MPSAVGVVEDAGSVTIADGLKLTTEIFTSGTAVIGIRGSGKTNCGVVLVEEAIAHGVPPCVIDPTSAWWGLKSSADGKSAGLPVYILGGQHGDVPLEEQSGAIVARFVVEQRVPVVLDVSDMSKGAQRRFVGEFAETLYQEKNRRRDPLFLVVDEAARFAPQMLPAKDLTAAKCVGALEDLLSLGRSRGIGCCIIGQRPATINKNVLTQADNLVALRTVGTQDRKALDEWVVNAQADTTNRDEMLRHLAGLGTGEGYFWSPGLFRCFERVKFVARSTFDSSRTPRAGETPLEPKVWATVDLEVLRGEMAAVVDRAKADDPKTMRARIAELERALAEKPKAEPLVNTVHVPVLTDDVLLRLESIVRSAKSFVTALESTLEPVADVLRNARLGDGGLSLNGRPSAGREVLETPIAAPEANLESPSRAPQRAERTAATSGLKAGARRMLEVLCRNEGTLSKAQLGTLADVNRSSGTFSEYLSALRREGLIEDAARTVTVTGKGAKAIGERIRREPLSTHAIVEAYAPKLKAGARRMLDLLVAAYPQAMLKRDLAEKADVSRTSGTFSEYLSALRRNGLVDDSSRTHVRASETLFRGPGR